MCSWAESISLPPQHVSADMSASLPYYSSLCSIHYRPWPYDQGWRRNFLEVFGRQRQYWLLPLHPAADAEAMRRAYLEWTLPWPIDSGQLDDHAGLEMSQSY